MSGVAGAQRLSLWRHPSAENGRDPSRSRRTLRVSACCLLVLSVSALSCRVRRMDEGKPRPEPAPLALAEKDERARATPEVHAHSEGGAPGVGMGSDGEVEEPGDPPRAGAFEGEAPLVPAEGEGADGAAPPYEGPRSLRAGWLVLAFGGGADFPPGFDDLVHEIVEESVSSIDAVVQIAARLEASPFTNAGLGSALRLDGVTIECDALVLDTEGRRGFVGGLRSTSSPVSVAAFLHRAGGATVRGAAADDLARRLGGSDANLLTETAEADYLSDLRLHAGRTSGHSSGSLESLYVNPEKLTRALTSAQSPRLRENQRLPVFVIVADGTTEALAASSGGIALSSPGAPTLLDAPHNAFVLSEQGAVAVLAPHGTCPDGAVLTSQHLLATRSAAVATEKLSKTCQGVPYLLLAGNTLRTNIAKSHVYLRGQGLEEPEEPTNLVPSPKDGDPVKPSAAQSKNQNATGAESFARRTSIPTQAQSPPTPRSSPSVPQPVPRSARGSNEDGKDASE